VLHKYSISDRLTRKCASCAELCHDRRVIFLVRTSLRLLGGRGRPVRAIERARAWCTEGTPSRARAFTLPSALGVLLSMSAAAQGLSASGQPASVAGPPIGPTMMRVVPYLDEMYALPAVAPAVPSASCYRVGRCSAYDLYRFRDRPNRLTRLAPEAPESVAWPASVPFLWSLVPATPEENILPQYRKASQVRDEYRAVGRPIDGPN